MYVSVFFIALFVLSLCVSLQSVTLAMLLKITSHKLYPVQLTVNTLTAFLQARFFYARGWSGVLTNVGWKFHFASCCYSFFIAKIKDWQTQTHRLGEYVHYPERVHFRG